MLLECVLDEEVLGKEVVHPDRVRAGPSDDTDDTARERLQKWDEAGSDVHGLPPQLEPRAFSSSASCSRVSGVQKPE